MQILLLGDEFAWAISAFCQLNRIPFDAALLLRQFPPPYTPVNLQQALTHLGFDSHLKKRSLTKLQAASLPCLAILNPVINDKNHTSNTLSDTTLADQPSATHQNTQPLALILSRDGERLLVIEPGQTEPRTISIVEFALNVKGLI